MGERCEVCGWGGQGDDPLTTEHERLLLGTLRYTGPCPGPGLVALRAERDALWLRNHELKARSDDFDSHLFASRAERDALRARVAELEAEAVLVGEGALLVGRGLVEHGCRPAQSCPKCDKERYRRSVGRSPEPGAPSDAELTRSDVEPPTVPDWHRRMEAAGKRRTPYEWENIKGELCVWQPPDGTGFWFATGCGTYADEGSACLAYLAAIGAP